MTKELIETGYKYQLFHITGKTIYRGCDCFKNCNCSINFLPESLDYYAVVRPGKKSTNHKTIEDAKKRIAEFNLYK